MYKVLLKDQYTSGYAKKIAGSYTLVAGFLIHQYMCQYTYGILMELGGVLMLCGRYVYGILTFVTGFIIHQYICQYTYGILMELGGVLMLCGRYVYGILTFVTGFIIHQYICQYTPVYLSVYILYTDGIRKCTDVVWKVCIRDSYIRGRISYSSLHMIVYILYTA